MMKLEAKPFNTNIMQVHAPTQDHDGEEIEKFYQEIQNGIKYAKSDEVICIMGQVSSLLTSLSILFAILCCIILRSNLVT